MYSSRQIQYILYLIINYITKDNIYKTLSNIFKIINTYKTYLYNNTILKIIQNLYKNKYKISNNTEHNITEAKIALYSAHLSSHKTSEIKFDTDAIPLILDTGESSTFTYNRDDFINYKSYQVQVQGLGKLEIKGKGTVKYNITDNNGEMVSLIIANVYHVPKMHIRLISPQQVSKQSRDNKEGIKERSSYCNLTWDGYKTCIRYHQQSKLPILYTTPNTKQYLNHMALCSTKTKNNKNY